MTSLLGLDSSSLPVVDLCSISVNGKVNFGSASKFWLMLLAEVSLRFPSWGRIRIAAPVSNVMSPVYLDPAKELQKMLFGLSEQDTGRLMEETVREMEIFGPPASVNISITSITDRVLYKRCMPDEFLDAEIFLYLAAWLYEWAEVPSVLWRQDAVEGIKPVELRNRQSSHVIRMSAVRTHINEGLYEHVLTLWNEASVRG